MSVRTAGLVLGCALLAGPARAQNLSLEPASAAPALTDAQKLERSVQDLDRMKLALRQVLARVEDARNEKDVVKLNCVNEKLTQIKALLKVAEQSDVALREAIANRDPGSDTELARIGMAGTKIETLRAETQQCVGQLAYVVDERTTVEVQQPEGLPRQDVTSRQPLAPGRYASPIRPRPASPYY